MGFIAQNCQKMTVLCKFLRWLISNGSQKAKDKRTGINAFKYYAIIFIHVMMWAIVFFSGGANLTIYTKTDILLIIKKLRFLGNSLQNLRKLSVEVRQDAGYQLDKVQCGEQPDDFKPMPSIGKGVEELRLWDNSGTYRVIYTARFADIVYVLHVFQKKTQTTSQHDIDLARKRYLEINERGSK